MLTDCGDSLSLLRRPGPFGHQTPSAAPSSWNGDHHSPSTASPSRPGNHHYSSASSASASTMTNQSTPICVVMLPLRLKVQHFINFEECLKTTAKWGKSLGFELVESAIRGFSDKVIVCSQSAHGCRYTIYAFRHTLPGKVTWKLYDSLDYSHNHFGCQVDSISTAQQQQHLATNTQTSSSLATATAPSNGPAAATPTPMAVSGKNCIDAVDNVDMPSSAATSNNTTAGNTTSQTTATATVQPAPVGTAESVANTSASTDPMLTNKEELPAPTSEDLEESSEDDVEESIHEETTTVKSPPATATSAFHFVPQPEECLRAFAEIPQWKLVASVSIPALSSDIIQKLEDACKTVLALARRQRASEIQAVPSPSAAARSPSSQQPVEILSSIATMSQWQFVAPIAGLEEEILDTLIERCMMVRQLIKYPVTSPKESSGARSEDLTAMEE